jgi:hypothetical protein
MLSSRYIIQKKIWFYSLEELKIREQKFRNNLNGKSIYKKLQNGPPLFPVFCLGDMAELLFGPFYFFIKHFNSKLYFFIFSF